MKTFLINLNKYKIFLQATKRWNLSKLHVITCFRSIITFLLKRYWKKEKCCGFLECNPINLLFPYFYRSYEVTSSYLLSWLNFTFCLVWYEKVYWETIKKLELLRLIKLQYIYTFDLSVCLWWKKTSKPTEPLRPNFLWQLTQHHECLCIKK